MDVHKNHIAKLEIVPTIQLKMHAIYSLTIVALSFVEHTGTSNNLNDGIFRVITI